MSVRVATSPRIRFESGPGQPSRVLFALRRKNMHGKIYDNISEVVGNTPLIRGNRVLPENAAELAVKLESFNPLSSVKDRIAYSMVTEAEKAGELKPGMTIVEARSEEQTSELQFHSFFSYAY